MLTIYDIDKKFGRRSFLKVGGLTLGGLTLPQLLAAKANAASGSNLVRDKSVVFLFLHGGPSQVETFDPKMTAPSNIRSATGEVSTSLPGITYGATFERLAALADKTSIVRSFRTGDSRHDIKPIVHRDTFNANLGSIYSRIVGQSDANTGMPTNVALFPRAVDPSTQPATMQFGKFGSTGELGTSTAPFVPGGGGDLQKDMELKLPMDRVTDRRQLLSLLDQVRKDVEGEDSVSRLREQAFSTILGGVAEAFDLSKEDPKTLARYDTSHISRPDNISKKWNNYNNYVDNGKTLGKLLLLSRRLCEAGCGFVTVTTNFVWDMHADVNNATMTEGMRYMGLPLDYAVSAFIEDVEARGLTDKILLVVCGEMGRTPKINAKGGRDHWGNISPLMLSGGGLNMGQVIGQSTRNVGEPLTEPYDIKHLVSTIMHTLFDISELRIAPGVPNDVARALSDWKPIDGLL